MNKKQIIFILWALWTLVCLIIVLGEPQIDWEPVGFGVLLITFVVGIVMLIVLAVYGFLCMLEELKNE